MDWVFLNSSTSTSLGLCLEAQNGQMAKVKVQIREIWENTCHMTKFQQQWWTVILSSLCLLVLPPLVSFSHA